MKKTLIILALITIIFSCSKGDDDASTTLQFDSSALEATGDLSEQSAEEAKKTIYGKWNFPSSSSARSACKLVSLEFTGQNYFMTLDAGYKGAISGKFTLGENASGKVEKVELKSIFDDNSEIVVAVLTNMVVTKTGDDLNATFNLVLTFPNDSGESSTFSFSSCNDALSGNIEAKSILIEKTAMVLADITAKRVLCKGKVRGDIHATNKLIITKEAEVTGNIYSPNLNIEKGALFEGQCSMPKNRTLQLIFLIKKIQKKYGLKKYSFSI